MAVSLIEAALTALIMLAALAGVIAWDEKGGAR